jgi:tRNA modification GTPase
MTGPGPSVFAVLTPPGRGGIAVIRCTGPDAEPALAACFRRPPHRRPGSDARAPSADVATGAPASDARHAPGLSRAADLPAPGALAYGHLLDVDGRAIDEIIVLRTPPPDTACEVHCHGGPAAVAAIRERLTALGLREVPADELATAEGAGPIERAARRMLQRTASPTAARILLDQLDGALARAIEQAAAAVPVDSASPPTTCATTVECASSAAFAATAAPAAMDGRAGALALIDLLDRWRTCGRFLARQPRIAIAGRPNAGKSTLLNRLAGADRAITSPIPGTTRDYVEATVALGGLAATLIDTAGLRATDHAIERAGVERARAEAARADVVVYLLDAREGVMPEDAAALRELGPRAIIAWNKVDACGSPESAPTAGAADLPGAAPLHISALAGRALPELVSAILARLGWREPPPGAAVPLTEEQAAAIERARAHLAAGRPADARTTLAQLLRDR